MQNDFPLQPSGLGVACGPLQGSRMGGSILPHDSSAKSSPVVWALGGQNESFSSDGVLVLVQSSTSSQHICFFQTQVPRSGCLMVFVVVVVVFFKTLCSGPIYGTQPGTVSHHPPVIFELATWKECASRRIIGLRACSSEFSR